MNVVYHGDYQVENDETNHKGMFLEWEYTTPIAVAFCIGQALQCFDGTEGTPEGLPAGKYCFYVANLPNWSTARPVYATKYLCFETTKDIPKGGIIKGSGTTITNSADGWAIQTKTSYLNTATVIETLTLDPQDSIPEGYTSLGTCWGENIGYGVLNWIECLSYGDNTWRDSDLRQWLNSDQDEWWTKKTRYNIQPNVASTLKGFLAGYSEDFKNKLKTIKVGTYTNTVKEKEGLVYTYDKIFIASNAQRNCNTGNSEQDNTTAYPEGKVWDYYKNLADGVSNLDTLGRFKNGSTYEILKRYAINAKTTAQVYWNKSAHRGGGNTVRHVNASGNVSSSNAYNSLRCFPACVI